MHIPDVLSCHSYRDFFTEFVAANRLRGRGFSYRALAKKTGWTPPYLNDVLKGKKNLTANKAIEFALALGIDEIRTERLLMLVFKEQASKATRDYAKKSLQRAELKLDTVDAVASGSVNYLYSDMRVMAVFALLFAFRRVPTYAEACAHISVIGFDSKRHYEQIVRDILAVGLMKKGPDGTLIKPDEVRTNREVVSRSDDTMRQAARVQKQYAVNTLNFHTDFMTNLPRKMKSALVWLTNEDIELVNGYLEKARAFIADLSKRNTQDLDLLERQKLRLFQYDLNVFPLGRDPAASVEGPTP